jgi:hypothetical protein
MRRLALAFVLLFLAGCTHPTPSAAPASSTPPVPPPAFLMALRVSEETPDGPPLAGVEVVAYPLDASGQATVGVARATDADGVVRYSFREPTRLAVRAAAPGWTREGAIVEVGPAVGASGALASDRDVFLPLYRTSLRLSASSSLTTSTALDARPALADLPLPAGYLARLSGAEVTVRWDESPTQRADLAAGLAWDGEVRAQGEPSGLTAPTGTRQATWSGAARPEGERLSAAAILHSAAVGDMPLAFEATLRFTGQEPAGLPKTCHSADACTPLPLPPLPAA